MISNKNGTFWGAGIVIITFILLGLTILLLNIAKERIKGAIGTEEIDKISREIDKINFYFSESFKLALDKTFLDLAKDSFADITKCSFYSEDGPIILKEDCKPEKEILIDQLEKRTSENIESLLKIYPNLDKIKVSCNIQENLLKCETDKISLQESRRASAFYYVLSTNFKLNEEKNIEKIDFEELDNLFENIKEKKESCKTEVSCYSTLKKWTIKSIKEEQNYFVFELESNQKFFVLEEENFKTINWKFAIEKS